MLTPYDEFPVHQAARPFSYIPSTDYAWDDGYAFAVFNPDEKLFLIMGLRVNPNTDMIGGYALINLAGVQHTVRFSRCWRQNFELRVGPFKIEFLELLKRIRLILEPHDGELEFDLIWEGVSPPVLEKHHVAEERGRLMTDQSRYSQAGMVSGVILFKGRRFDVEPARWSGSRDHSWGLYTARPPLSPTSDLLPPKPAGLKRRAFRLWCAFRSDPFSGFFEMNEDSDGRQGGLTDVYGTPLGGRIFRGWCDGTEIISLEHDFHYRPGTRLLTHGAMKIGDTAGDEWLIEIEVASPPWMPMTMGYTPGSWKDGGTFHTYHGSEELSLESDEFDFSSQPLIYKPYLVAGREREDSFGFNFDSVEPIVGQEYLVTVKTMGPDGEVGIGSAHLEHVITGAYRPYGFD